ncbi:MAG: PTS sugar transporter subunit IIA [Spirochaetales bacterium]|nr:MAG: PTS sugar transporter subunit IIA [Spirochaetales bacterium]
MSLIELLGEEVIKVPLVSVAKTDVIAELLDVLVAAGKITNRERALDALLQRESQGSTGLESGIAVPHAKSDAVQTLTVAIGTAPGGIEFEAMDGKPSHLFFLMLAPPDQSGPHIEALAEIARLARSPAFLKALANAESAKDIMELLNE